MWKKECIVHLRWKDGNEKSHTHLHNISADIQNRKKREERKNPIIMPIKAKGVSNIFITAIMGIICDNLWLACLHRNQWKWVWTWDESKRLKSKISKWEMPKRKKNCKKSWFLLHVFHTTYCLLADLTNELQIKQRN